LPINTVDVDLPVNSYSLGFLRVLSNIRLVVSFDLPFITLSNSNRSAFFNTLPFSRLISLSEAKLSSKNPLEIGFEQAATN
jgi:hypothetical protein